MKKGQYRISIPKPCHENWADMTENEKGRFCAACHKTVIDFRYKSDAEIYETLSQGNVCGRFTARQVAAPLTVSSSVPGMHWWQAAMLMACATLASCNTGPTMGKARTDTEIVNPDNPALKGDWKQVQFTIADSETHKPINFATITVSRTDSSGREQVILKKTKPDSTGLYHLALPMQTDLKLTCTATNYKDITFVINDLEDQTLYMQRINPSHKVTKTEVHELMGDTFIAPVRVKDSSREKKHD